MTEILLITGPSGAGKTTTCNAFLNKASGTWAYINQDDIRQLVKAGYATADGYESSWSQDTRNQWAVSIRVCCAMARQYQVAGINCLIDLFTDPNEYQEWETLLVGTNHKLVILRPKQAAALQRNRGRQHPSRLTDNKIREAHQKHSHWPENKTIIDTSTMAVEDVVEKLLEYCHG